MQNSHGQMLGDIVEDDLVINSTAISQAFMQISQLSASQSVFELGYDGFLELSKLSYHNGLSWIYNLFSDNIIKTPQIGMKLVNEEEIITTEVDIGYLPDLGYTWINAPYYDSWKTVFESVKCGKVSQQNPTVLFDTSSFYVMYPSKFSIDVIGYLDKDACECSSAYECACDSRYDYIDLPDIVLNLGKDTLIVQPKQYTYYGTNSTLHILLRPWDEDYWSVGVPFLQNYYISFDFGNSRIGLYKLQKSHTILYPAMSIAIVIVLFLVITMVGSIKSSIERKKRLLLEKESKL